MQSPALERQAAFTEEELRAEGPEGLTMKQMAKQLSEELSTDVKFQVGTGKSSAIVVKFSSHTQRGEWLRYMNLER